MGNATRIRNISVPNTLNRKVWDVKKHLGSCVLRINKASQKTCAKFYSKALCTKGQGTTEYAILVGVIVVIAILAITVFKPKLEELWNAISSGITSL